MIRRDALKIFFQLKTTITQKEFLGIQTQKPAEHTCPRRQCMNRLIDNIHEHPLRLIWAVFLTDKAVYTRRTCFPMCKTPPILLCAGACRKLNLRYFMSKATATRLMIRPMLAECILNAKQRHSSAIGWSRTYHNTAETTSRKELRSFGILQFAIVCGCNASDQKVVFS